MTSITLSPEQAKGIIASVDKRCQDIAIKDVFNIGELNPRDQRNVGEIIRECVLEFEEARIAAKRAEKGEK